MEKGSCIFICQDEGQKHWILNQWDSVVSYVGLPGLVLHENQSKGGWENQAEAVDNVQSFKADCVFYPWLSRQLGIESEENLDADGGDHEEDCSDDCVGDANVGENLVPVAERDIGQIGFILCKVWLW